MMIISVKLICLPKSMLCIFAIRFKTATDDDGSHVLCAQIPLGSF